MLKKFIAVICAVVLVLCVCSCSRKDPADDEVMDPDITAYDLVTAVPVITNEDFNLVRMLIYTVDAASASVVSTTVMIRDDTEITPALVTDYIVEALKDESVKLSFEDIGYDSGVCVIDFDDSICSIADGSAQLEDAILDAIAQSILDNVPGCMKVIYRINGSAYSTVNLTFPFDYVYMDN